MGFPIVFFDKCIGRKRNVGGGVLAGLSGPHGKGRPKRDFGGTYVFFKQDRCPWPQGCGERNRLGTRQ